MLVVDDNPTNRTVLTHMVAGFGSRSDAVPSGAKSLEVLRQVRQFNQQLPIVVITAAESKDLAVRSISLGAQAYVLKPFNPKELAQVADRWFAQAISQPRPTTSGSMTS